MTSPLIDTSARLADNAGLLGVLLAHWSNRNEIADQAASIRSGYNAVGVIDDMLRALHGARAALMGEIRQDQG